MPNVKNLRKKKSTATVRLLERLKRVECPDTTFVSETFPKVFKKASGLYVHDTEGKRYTDFTAFFGVAALGHRPDATRRAVRSQMAKIIHGMGDIYPTESKIKFLELMAKLSPYSKPKGLLGLSGSDAIQAAMKTAMLATNKTDFIAFEDGYHGVHFGPLSLTENPYFKEGFRSWTNGYQVHYLPYPAEIPRVEISGSGELSSSESDFLSLETLESLLKNNPVAGLFVELYQGRGGGKKISNHWLKEAAFLCKKYSTLLIFDEIFTGLGRTGTLFAQEQFDVIPDLMCLGKALGGGFPLSLCLGDIMDVWRPSTGEARHTQTFLGHPLACEVGYETVKTIVKTLPELQKELPKIDAVLKDFLQKYQNSEVSLNHPIKIQGAGWMRSLDFHQSPDHFAVRLMETLCDAGFLTLPKGAAGKILGLTPPLIATALDFKKMLGGVEKVLSL